MPPRIRAVYSAIAFTGMLIAGIPLLTELVRRGDIWWTPATMMVPLAQAGDRVEIYARGEPLGALLERGRLQVVDQDGNNTLKPGDVALRFNNRDRLRSERLPGLLIDAAVLGMTATMFLLLATGRLAYRPEKEPAAARPNA